MVRTPLDLKKMQSVQGEALQDTNKDVKKGATALAPARKKFDEKNAVRQRANIRLHRDMIRALQEHAELERITYTDIVRRCVAIGMKQLGIEYKARP